MLTAIFLRLEAFMALKVVDLQRLKNGNEYSLDNIVTVLNHYGSDESRCKLEVQMDQHYFEFHHDMHVFEAVEYVN